VLVDDVNFIMQWTKHYTDSEEVEEELEWPSLQNASWGHKVRPLLCYKKNLLLLLLRKMDPFRVSLSLETTAIPAEAESDDDVVESEDEDGVTVADGSEEDEADSDYDGEDESDGLVCSLSSFEWNFSWISWRRAITGTLIIFIDLCVIVFCMCIRSGEYSSADEGDEEEEGEEDEDVGGMLW
jgi:hypothetical protein